jgi:hypothetical protein
MQNLGQLYFVTLTRPNVKARQLKSEIKKMLSGFQKIKDNLRKTYKIKLQGIRKIEITYNHKTDSYHPHFHFIQDNLHATELMQDLWLQQFSNASIKGQDIRSIDMQDENSFIEIFNYTLYLIKASLTCFIYCPCANSFERPFNDVHASHLLLKIALELCRTSSMEIFSNL